jgi:hypothetical protein
MLAGPYGEADLEGERLGEASARCSYPPEPPLAWKAGESDIHELTVPPGEYPSQNLPGSIREAVLDSLDQVPSAPLGGRSK